MQSRKRWVKFRCIGTLKDWTTELESHTKSIHLTLMGRSELNVLVLRYKRRIESYTIVLNRFLFDLN
jgi:hypothetical protein